MWRRVLQKEMIERRHLDEEALLDRRRRVLESATGPTVPKTLRGPDAPTESERTAHEITQLHEVRELSQRLAWSGLGSPSTTGATSLASAL